MGRDASIYSTSNLVERSGQKEAGSKARAAANDRENVEREHLPSYGIDWLEHPSFRHQFQLPQHQSLRAHRDPDRLKVHCYSFLCSPKSPKNRIGKAIVFVVIPLTLFALAVSFYQSVLAKPKPPHEDDRIAVESDKS